MVAAYLRGLLKPNHQYGLRSRISEDVVIEALATEMMATNMTSAVNFDLTLIPVLNEKGRLAAVDRVTEKLRRVAELRANDLYRVADQLTGSLRLSNTKKELSLFQLYQIAEKHGIFEEFSKAAEKAKFRKML
jgi:hypothetical protein